MYTFNSLHLFYRHIKIFEYALLTLIISISRGVVKHNIKNITISCSFRQNARKGRSKRFCGVLSPFPPSIYISRQYYYVKKTENILHFKEMLIKYS